MEGVTGECEKGEKRGVDTVGAGQRVETLEGQGRFLLDRQEQDSNAWHNIAFNLREEVQEGEQKIAALQDLLDVQRKSSQ